MASILKNSELLDQLEASGKLPERQMQLIRKRFLAPAKPEPQIVQEARKTRDLKSIFILVIYLIVTGQLTWEHLWQYVPW